MGGDGTGGKSALKAPCDKSLSTARGSCDGTHVVPMSQISSVISRFLPLP